MIASTSKYTFKYRCWKCKTPHLIQQDGPDEIMDLKCEKCGKTLLRVNAAPGVSCESSFMRGSHADDGFGNCEWMRKAARSKAAAAGVDVTGAKYCPELCPKGETLSPKAWVKDASDVKRRAAELGKGVDGVVKAPAPYIEPAEEKPYRVREEIVNRRVESVLEKAGVTAKDLGPKEYTDLKEREAKLASGSE